MKYFITHFIEKDGEQYVGGVCDAGSKSGDDVYECDEAIGGEQFNKYNEIGGVMDSFGNLQYVAQGKRIIRKQQVPTEEQKELLRARRVSKLLLREIPRDEQIAQLRKKLAEIGHPVEYHNRAEEIKAEVRAEVESIKGA